MNFFALDTATERLSLAILRGEHEFVREIDAGQAHSALTLPAMTSLLREAGLTLREIDGFVFGQGPGSFTGVRIACGFVQGLALGSQRPLVAISTLLALAEQAGAPQVLVAQDARMGEFYLAAYVQDAAEASGWRALVEPMLAAADALPALPGGAWHGIGSGFDVAALSAHLDACYGTHIGSVTHQALPRALDLALIAKRQGLLHGAGTDAATAVALPLYLRNKVALTLAERVSAKSAPVVPV